MIELYGMLVKGIEPPAYALRVRCSTPELHQLTAFFCQTKYIIHRLEKNATLSLTVLSLSKVCGRTHEGRLQPQAGKGEPIRPRSCGGKHLQNESGNGYTIPRLRK